MANTPINKRGINESAINGPPPTYVNGAATLSHGHSFGGDAQSYDEFVNASSATSHGHSLTAVASPAFVRGKAGINVRAINTHKINNLTGLYVNAQASMYHGHTFGGDLTLGFDTYVYGAASLSHGHTFSGDLTFFQNFYSDGAAEMSHGHTLSGDLTFFYSTIVYGESVMTHGHTFEGDLTFGYNYYVDGAAVMTHGHTGDGNGQQVIHGSAQASHDHTFGGDLTFGSDIVVFASASWSHAHTLQGDFKLYDPVDFQALLLVPHTFGGDLTLLPYIEGQATLQHSHSLTWTDTQSVLGSATMLHAHVIYATALGGTPNIDVDNFWPGADPLLDIETRDVSQRTKQFFGMNYDVDGFQYWQSGTNFCPVNTAPVNEGCGAYPEPDISGELGQQYGVGETQGVLNQQWHYVYDKDQEDWTLDQQWDLDTGTQALYQWELGNHYAQVGTTYLNAMLALVNAKRADFGLIPYSLYDGQGEDVATTHTENMADTGIFAHEDGGFPPTYQTVAERVLKIYEGPSGYGENLAGSVSSVRHFPDVAWLFNQWWTSPDHKANILHDWAADSNPQMLLGFDMLYDWASAPGNWTTFWTQLFIGYGIPLGATLKQWELTQEYAVDTVLITQLSQGYSLDAYTPVEVQHEALYGINVAAQHEAPYVCRVAAQHEAPIYFGLTVQHEAPYGDTAFVRTQHEALYEIDEYNPVAQQHEATYSMAPLVAQHEAQYALTLDVAAQHEAPYGATVDLAAQHEAQYGLLSYQPVVAQHESIYALLGDLVSTSVPIQKVVHKGVTRVVDRAWVAVNGGDIAWTFEAQLLKVGDFQAIKRKDPVTLFIGPDEYEMVVESKDLRREGPADLSIIIRGSSPIVLKDAPYTSKITKTYITAMTAQAIAEDLVGEVIDWQMVNWTIPAYRVAVKNGSAVQMARKIVAAAGGVLESKQDGTLLARPKYPVPTPAFDTSVPDFVLTDAQDNLSASESFKVAEGYNKFRIREGDSVYSDRIDYVENEDPTTGGIVRAYPSPWRTTVQLAHTWDSRVSISPLGIRTRQETEVVEFVAGRGTTKNPILSIDTVSWMSLSLTGLSFDTHGKEITTSSESDYGLAEITYTVQSIDYEVSQPVGTSAQFTLEDL